MITDADVDALIAAGDPERAASIAAELVDPIAYRNAMIRAFEASKHVRPIERDNENRTLGSTPDANTHG